MRRLMAIFASAMLLLVLLAPMALADGDASTAPAAPAAKPPTVTLDTTAGQKGAVVLTATVRDGDGKVISDADVRFYVQADFFAKRGALIGEGTTDTTGSVSVSYVPTWTGTNQFSAKFTGADGNPVTGQANFDVAKVQPIQAKAPEEIPLVRQGTALLAVVATAGVWLLMLTVIFRVGFGVKRQAAVTAGSTRRAAREVTAASRAD